MHPISAQDFALGYEFNGHRIQYEGITEVSQGGPAIGKLFIDGNDPFPENYFSGPLLFDGQLLFAPLLNKTLFETRFSICTINLNTLRMQIVGPKNILILLEKVENKKIYYFTNREHTKRRNIPLKQPG